LLRANQLGLRSIETGLDAHQVVDLLDTQSFFELLNRRIGQNVLASSKGLGANA
jgi:hypothetical protein